MDNSNPNDSARTPLAEISKLLATSGNGEVALTEAPLCGQLTIRVDWEDQTARDAVEKTVGMELPTKTNTFVEDESQRLFWIGPSEWLLTLEDDATAAMADKLRNSTKDMHVATVDVSDNRTRLVLTGPKVWDVLNKTCTLNLHPSTWNCRQCAQTLVGRSQVLLAMTSDENPEFQLFVRNSFAEYLAGFLIEAMREFQSP